MKKITKRIITYITLVAVVTCVIFFVFNRPKQVKAEVVSGAVLGAGLLAVLGASFFSLYGIDVNFEGMTSGQVNDFFNSYASSYINAQQIDNNMWNTVTGAIESAYYDQVTAMSKGLENTAEWSIAVGNDVANFFTGFADWFSTSLGLSSVQETGIVNYNSITVDGVTYNYYVNNPTAMSSVFPCVLNTSGSYSIGNFSWDFTMNPASRFSYVFYKNGVRTSSDYINCGIPSNAPAGTHMYDFCKVAFCVRASGALNMALWKRMDSTSNYVNYYRVSMFCGDTGINVNNYDVSTISVEGSLNEGYQDYQDALNGVLDDAGTFEDGVVVTGVGTYEGVLTGENLIENVLADVAVNEYTATLEGAYEDQEAAEKEHEGSAAVPSITVPEGWVTINGLEDFFPFCIPFDLYAIIEQLNVPPTTPKFTYTISFGGLFQDEEIDIDLTPFDTVAQIFRIMMAIGFVVFLIIKTRDLIRG